MDESFEGRPAAVNMRPAIQLDPDHLRIVEGGPVAEDGNQLVGTSDMVPPLHSASAWP